MFKIIMTHFDLAANAKSKLKEIITHEKIKQHGKKSENDKKEPHATTQGKKNGQTN